MLTCHVQKLCQDMQFTILVNCSWCTSTVRRWQCPIVDLHRLGYWASRIHRRVFLRRPLRSVAPCVLAPALEIPWHGFWNVGNTYSLQGWTKVMIHPFKGSCAQCLRFWYEQQGIFLKHREPKLPGFDMFDHKFICAPQLVQQLIDFRFNYSCSSLILTIIAIMFQWYSPFPTEMAMNGISTSCSI